MTMLEGLWGQYSGLGPLSIWSTAPILKGSGFLTLIASYTGCVKLSEVRF